MALNQPQAPRALLVVLLAFGLGAGAVAIWHSPSTPRQETAPAEAQVTLPPARTSPATSSKSAAADTKAEEVLVGFGRFYQELPRFRVHLKTEEESIQPASKFEKSWDYDFAMERPNSFALIPTGDTPGGFLVSDGKELTAYAPMTKRYVQKPATPTLAAMLSGFDFSVATGLPRSTLSKLLATDVAFMFRHDPASSAYLGQENLDGTPAHHVRLSSLGSRTTELWIATGEKPLLLKVAEIDYRVSSGSSSPSTHTLTDSFSNWVIDQPIPAETFIAKLPADAVLSPRLLGSPHSPPSVRTPATTSAILDGHTVITNPGALNPATLPPGRHEIVVTPQGDFAAIDIQASKDALLGLKTKSGPDRDALIRDIETHSNRYIPPVFLGLATILYDQGNRDDAIFWLNAGRLRGNFDATRCTDVSAKGAIVDAIRLLPDGLRKAQFDDPEKLRQISAKVIAWDQTTPYDYDPRWINLHGLIAIQSGLGKTSDAPMTTPPDTWKAMAQKNREDYQKDLEKALAVVEGQIAQEKQEVEWAKNGDAPSISVSSGEVSAAPCPQIRYQKTLNLQHFDGSLVALSFSPDGRTLASLSASSWISGPLVLWDLNTGQPQTQIDTKRHPYPTLGNTPILWGPQGKWITAMDATWDAMSGAPYPLPPTVKIYGSNRLNPDRTKLLTTAKVDRKMVLRIYDTRTWASTDYDLPGPMDGFPLWTGENKIVFIGQIPPDFKGPQIEDSKTADIVGFLIDPEGKMPTVTRLLAASEPISTGIKQPRGPQTINRPALSLPSAFSDLDWVGNKIAIGNGSNLHVLDGHSLNALWSYSLPKTDSHSLPYGMFKFSPDGRYLYLTYFGRTTGTDFILDGATGKLVGTFPAGPVGFAISPDGKQMALGYGDRIKLYSVEAPKNQ